MANEPKWTGGPWVWESDALYGKDDGYTVAVIDEAYFPDGNDLTEGNKSAIASVPEITSALRWIDINYDNQDLDHVEFRVEAARMAREALAKARGES